MGLEGSSFYDTINKTVIGFLILFPWIDIRYWQGISTLEAMSCMVWFWMTGLLFWSLSSFYFYPKCTSKYLALSYLSTNNMDWINQTYHQTSSDLGLRYKDNNGNDYSRLTLTNYLLMYYYIQKNGLLGVIPILESYSSFFRNIIIIIVYWIVLTLFNITNILSGFAFEQIIYWGQMSADSMSYNQQCWHIFLFSTLLLMLLLFSCISRKKTELIIQRNIIEAYLLSR